MNHLNHNMKNMILSISTLKLLMKKINFYISFFAIFIALNLNSQIQFWSDDFEDVGNPSSGVRNPSSEVSSGGSPVTKYFMRCSAHEISSVNPYSIIQGSKFWAGEDHRLTPISQTPHQSITWS